MKILNNKEFNNASWLIGGRIIQMILSLVVGVLTARYLGPSNFGVINYATAYITFFTSFCNLGINSIIIKDFVENPEKQGETIGTTLILRLLSSILSTILITFIVYMLDNDEPLTILVTFLCSISLVFKIFDTINYWFQSRYQSKITSLSTICAYIIVSIYKIILLMTGKDVRWFAFASSFEFICIAVFLWIAYKKNHGPKLSFSINKGKYLLHNSYHYILSGMMVAIYGQTDKFMLKHMLNQSEVGFYSIATTVCNMWVFVLVAIIDSMYPTIMKLHKENNNSYERKNIQLYSIVFYLSISVSIFFMLFGDIFINILYGAEYINSVLPLKIVTWYTAFSYLGVARNAWVVCEDKQKYLKYMYIGSAFMNIILNLLLIPHFGACGAALASLITEILSSLIVPCFIKDMRPNVKLMIKGILLKDVF